MRAALLGVLVSVVGCAHDRPAPAPPSSTGGAACAPRQLATVGEPDRLVLASDGEALYWASPDRAVVTRRDRDGTVTVLVPPRDDHPSIGPLVVADGWVVWPARGDDAVWRVRTTGGAAERLFEVEQPTRVAVFGGSVWATTTGGAPVRWAGGRLETLPVENVLAIAGAGTERYLGHYTGVERRTETDPTLTHVVTSDEVVAHLEVTATSLYWFEAVPGGGVLHRRPRGGGADETVADLAFEETYFARVGDGLYVGVGRELFYVDDTLAQAVAIGTAPGTVTSLAVLDDTLVVATTDGVIHAVCARRP